MSNTYNSELEQALKQVTDQLEASELTEGNVVDSSKINLYYAHGITEKTQDKLDVDQTKSKVAGKQFRAAADIYRVTENIVNDANTASLDTGNTTSTVSTAASSFQTAANALTNLWADTAAVLAVATSVDNHDKIKEMAQQANSLTSIAAKSAEEATLISLNTTIDASQSRAANVVTQAGVVKTDMQNLESALETGFSTLQDQVNSDLGDLSAAIESESQKAGALNIATSEETALKDAAAFMNQEVNYNLLMTPGDSAFGDEFKLSFNAFKESETDVSGDPCNTSNKPLKTTKIIDEYRVLIVPADEVPSFDIQIAKAVRNTEVNGQKINRYVRVKPRGAQSYSTQYYLTEFFAMHPVDQHKDSDGKTLEYIAYDYTGKPVRRGESYGFFVYAIYTSAYQANTGDTEGYLSLASDLFTNKADLPSPAPATGTDYCNSTNKIHLCFNEKDDNETVRVSFEIDKDKMVLPNTVDLDMFMEFRVFLFSNENKEALCENLKIQDQVAKVNSNRAALNEAESQLETAEEAYNTAAAQGLDGKKLQALEKKIGIAQTNVSNAEIAYKSSVMKLNEAYKSKISDFYLDSIILESIPEAYCLTAKRSKESKYVESLILRREAQKEEETRLNTQIQDNNKRVDALDKKVLDLQNKINKADEEIIALEKQNEELTIQTTEMYEVLSEILMEERFILDLEYMLGLQANLPKDLLAEQKEAVEKITQNLQTIESNKKAIGDKNNQNTERLAKINDMDSQVTIIKLENQIYEAELKAIPKEIENLDEEIKKYQKEEGDNKDGYFYYEAENNSGDFTNNYGDILIPGEEYTALVFSVIKDNRSDVEPQYQCVYSKFSHSVKFTGLNANNQTS